MGKIFYLMGKSASGKDTIYKRLMEDESLHLGRIVMYTTRPKRSGEEEGVEYHFADEDMLSLFENEGKVIELRSYTTCHGIWKYFTVDDGNINLDQNNYLMIGTIESFVGMRNYFGKEKVLPVYIDLEDGLRLERAFLREKSQAEPKYAEMCRRFLADEKDFSLENLQKAGIEDGFKNHELEICLEQVKQFIIKEK